MKKLLSMLLLPSMAWANYSWMGKRVDGDELRNELTAVGCVVTNIDTTGIDGIIYGPKCPAAQSVLDAHNPDVRKNRKTDSEDRLRLLKAKLDDNSITQTERDEVLVRLLEYHGI